MRTIFSDDLVPESRSEKKFPLVRGVTCNRDGRDPQPLTRPTMNHTNPIRPPTRWGIALAALLAAAGFANEADAAMVFYQTGAAGGGSQNFYAANNPIAGTMSAPVPLFNGGLGTLLQADFEFAASTAGTWYSNPAPSGTSSISLSGPADAGGQPMGNLAVGFTGPINNSIPSNDFDSNFANLTVTSGPFFNSLTGAGNLTMSWIYSGNSTLSTPAVGAGPGNEGFSWGGSVHVTYTYEPVPEPGVAALGSLSLLGMVLAARRNKGT